MPRTLKNVCDIAERPYETFPVERVEDGGDSWVITTDKCMVFGGLRKSYGIEPKVGDMAGFYGRGFGSTVRGLAINGVVAYYRTEAEQHALDLQEQAKRDTDRRAEFEQNRAKMDAEYDALPEVFRRRLDKFRNTNPEFRWRFEEYEMCCCKDALKIAAAVKTVEAVQKFHDATSEEQERLVPDMDKGHSGNSFGFACRLAYLYLTDPELVVKEHGALTPLVGCKTYGCPHPEE